MTTDELRWIVDACTEHGALLFVWIGKVGHQAVLMPGYTYYWWLDDDSPSLQQETEGDCGHRRFPH